MYVKVLFFFYLIQLLCLCTARITLARRLIISISSVIHLSVTYFTLPKYAGCGEVTPEWLMFCV